jgi:hypothetical protein
VTTPAVNVYTIFAQAAFGGTVAAGSGPATQANQFSLSQNAQLTGIWWYSPSGATNLPTQCGIYLVSGQTLIAANVSPVWSGTAGSGWVRCAFDGTITLFAGVSYKACVFAPSITSYFSSTANYWISGSGANGIINGIITAPNNASASPGQGSLSTTAGGLTYPGTTAGPGGNNWIDVEVTTGLPVPVPPVAGFGLSAPRTWSTGDLVTTPRLRADMYNTAALMNEGRPFTIWEYVGNAPSNVITIPSEAFQFANSWNTAMTQWLGTPTGQGTAQFYPVPLPGWYLVKSSSSLTPVSGGAANSLYDSGIVYSQGTATLFTRTDLSQICGTSTGTFTIGIGLNGSELILLDTGDMIAGYVYGNPTGGPHFQLNVFAEWVGLPSSGTINSVPYSGATGVVVTSPKPASLWPPGPGVTLSGSASAGGTALSLPPVPGLRAGQNIGLDWQSGVQAQPFAEVVQVAAVTGGTVTTSSPLRYGHSAGAPVAVPVSAAFLNEQIRDQANFAFYPPILRAIQGTASTQTISNNTWTTINLSLTGSGVTGTIDNFSGFASNSYTIPVSGIYEITGQVYFVGSSSGSSWGAAIIDNNGVRYQGDFYRTATSSPLQQSPAVRRLLRLTAGQTITLQGFQNSGAGVSTNAVQTLAAGTLAQYFSRLIIVFRSF